MRGRGRSVPVGGRAGGGLLWWGLVVAAMVGMVLGGWTVIRSSVGPPGEADGEAALLAAGVTAFVAAVMLAVSERRVRSDLADQRIARGIAAGTVATSLLRTRGAVSGMAVRGVVHGSADVIDVLAAVIAGLFTLVAAGWAVDAPAVPLYGVWLGGVGLALLAAWGVTRRVGALMHVNVRVRDAFRTKPVPLFVAGASGGVFGWWKLTSAAGGVEWPAVTVAGILAGGLVAGPWVAVRLNREERAKRPLAGVVAAALGVSDAVLEVTRWRVEKGSIVVVPPLPAPVIARLPDLPSRVAVHMPAWEVARVSPSGVELISAGMETIASREMLAASEGLVRGAKPVPDALPHRPDAEEWVLSPEVGPSAAPRVAHVAAGAGMSLVEWAPEAHRAVVARLPQDVADIRARVAASLGAPEWQVELAVDRHESGRLDRVVVLRAPVIPVTEKRLLVWREIVTTVIPDGSVGWKVEDFPQEGRVVLTWGPKPVLPKVVPAGSVLPEGFRDGAWNLLPMGRAADGSVVSADLKAGPHTLVVGGTGSGKSTALRLIQLGALARGFELIIVDPTKRAAGMKSVGPWTKGIFTKSDAEAAEVLSAVYAEVRRRVDLIDDVDGENWLDLPAGTVRPWLVIVDEFSGLVKLDKKPVGLSAGDDELVEWQEQASAKAKIVSMVGKIAREARSAGVHMVLSTQRPDAEDIPGQVREQMGTIVQLVPPARPPSGDALRMVFPSEYAAVALDQIEVLNDGRSPGFALSYLDGGGLRAFRVGYAEPDDVVRYLGRVGVPDGVPLELAGDGVDVFGGGAAGGDAVVIDRGTVELSLDDLDEFVAVDAVPDAVPVSAGAGSRRGGRSRFGFDAPDPDDDWSF